MRFFIKMIEFTPPIKPNFFQSFAPSVTEPKSHSSRKYI